MRQVVGSILISKYRLWCTLTFLKCVTNGKLCQNATLRLKSQSCEFGSLQDSLIRDRVVVGIPEDFKCAHVNPILKKTILSKEDLNSYRPISNLSFISKNTRTGCCKSTYFSHQHKWFNQCITVCVQTISLNRNCSFKSTQ